jgi:hypothetical protein
MHRKWWLRNSSWDVNSALTGAYYLCLKREARSNCFHCVILQLFAIRSRLLLRGNIKAYGTITVPVFLRYETPSFTLCDEHNPSVFKENDGPKKKTVSGVWIKHRKELYDLYSAKYITGFMISWNRVCCPLRAEKKMKGFGGGIWGKFDTRKI